MSFYGVFIGIDRCASPSIDELRFAKRDAVALRALFADAFGGETTLLADEEGTRSRIEEELERLASCTQDDLVVVTFSGHGTRTHHLVAYDTEKRNLENTGISLEALGRYLSRIPARRLICVLDCCFSGGMGAKTLEIESAPRDISSADELLDQMSGNGRLILTASAATEAAWEDIKLGHGLLTYHLIQALLGAEEAQKAGKLSVYRLMQFVTESVLDYSTRSGKLQQPTLRGEIDGDFSWPVFKLGKLYCEAFPEKQRPQITHDIQSLIDYRFPQALLDAWAGAIPSLNQLQVDAINAFDLLEGKHLVVSAPTSSGKTMVGELAGLKGVLERRSSVLNHPMLIG